MWNKELIRETAKYDPIAIRQHYLPNVRKSIKVNLKRFRLVSQNITKKGTSPFAMFFN